MLLVAVTTVLGMIPLLQDPFFVAMAATIMFGLAFACVLTMIVVPVLYAIFFGVREDAATELPGASVRGNAPADARQKFESPKSCRHPQLL